MRIFVTTFTTIIGLLTTACVTVPPFRSDSLTPADIALNVKCELAEAVRDGTGNHWLLKWNVVADLTLTVVNSNDIGGDGSLTIPLSPGLAIPALAFGLDTRASRTATLTFKEDLKKLANSNICDIYNDETNRLPFRLNGNLGIYAWFDRVDRARRKAKLDGISQVDYTVDFRIVKSLTPSFTVRLIPVGFRTFNGGASSALTASYTHKLRLVLTKKPPSEKPPPTRVVIVEDQRQNAEQIRQLTFQIVRLKKELDALRGRKTQYSLQPQFHSGKKDPQLEKFSNDEADLMRELNVLKTQRKSLRSRRPRFRPSERGLSERAKRDLDGALTRSILRDIEGDLRDLNINP